METHINTYFLDVTLCWLRDRHHFRGTSASILINMDTADSTNVFVPVTQTTQHHIPGQ